VIKYQAFVCTECLERAICCAEAIIIDAFTYNTVIAVASRSHSLRAIEAHASHAVTYRCNAF
jgi:hypothetical protein